MTEPAPPRERFPLRTLLAMAVLTVIVFLLALFFVECAATEDDDDAAAATPTAVSTLAPPVATPTLAAALAAPASATACATTPLATLPFEYTHDPAWRDRVDRARSDYAEYGVDYRPELAGYTTDGDYLNWGSFKQYGEGGELRFDDAGIPTINANSDGQYYYHVSNIAQYALILHGRFLLGESSLSEFLRVTDFLMGMQEADGSFPMEQPFHYYLTGETLAPGWESGLTYGQVLNVFARAWQLSGDQKYRDAGDRALAAMTRPASEGGTVYSLAPIDPALAEYIIFEEYPSHPTFFTLNGFMIAMLGLYDWWQLDPGQQVGTSAIAHEWFECSMATLTTILPLYDVGGMTAYDLGHLLRDVVPNANPSYHSIHIVLLHALASVTGDPTLETFEQRWRAYVDVPPMAAN